MLLKKSYEIQQHARPLQDQQQINNSNMTQKQYNEPLLINLHSKQHNSKTQLLKDFQLESLQTQQHLQQQHPPYLDISQKQNQYLHEPLHLKYQSSQQQQNSQELQNCPQKTFRNLQQQHLQQLPLNQHLEQSFRQQKSNTSPQQSHNSQQLKQKQSIYLQKPQQFPQQQNLQISSKHLFYSQPQQSQRLNQLQNFSNSSKFQYKHTYELLTQKHSNNYHNNYIHHNHKTYNNCYNFSNNKNYINRKNRNNKILCMNNKNHNHQIYQNKKTKFSNYVINPSISSTIYLDNTKYSYNNTTSNNKADNWNSRIRTTSNQIKGVGYENDDGNENDDCWDNEDDNNDNGYANEDDNKDEGCDNRGSFINDSSNCMTFDNNNYNDNTNNSDNESDNDNDDNNGDTNYYYNNDYGDNEDGFVAMETTRTTNVLPPCRVCNEKASGFHYGVNTCEACKGFFRRCLKRKVRYICHNINSCEVVAAKRGHCSACRYRKCIALGMSKTAIKTGRYTHEKRQQDQQEVTKLFKKGLLTNDPDIIRDLDRIIEVITATQSNHFKWDFIIKSLHRGELKYMEHRAKEEKMFGSLGHIAMEDYLDIYNLTGIDVDGRRNLVLKLLPLVEKNLRSLVYCAKFIPGFDCLPVEDRIEIIKTSRFEIWMITHHHQFNPSQQLYTTLSGTVICLDDMLKVHSKGFMELLLFAQERIQKLQLNFKETCVLASLVMMFTDRCELKDRRTVESIQDLLLRCFYQLIARRFKGKRQEVKTSMYFARVSSVLTLLRNVRSMYAGEEARVIRLWFDKVPVSPLIYEMWTL